MITKQECADWINANISTELTTAEIDTLKNSIVNHPLKDILLEILITVLGDISILVEIRDKS